METQNDSILMAVAISIVSSPGRRDLWREMRATEPGELYARIAAGEPPAVQAHVARQYAGTPLEAAKRIREMAERRDVRIVSMWDDSYPSLLREIYRPPLVLYVRGDPAFDRMIAIVGTRAADAGSASIARQISTELTAAGLCVVSGMAVGIDREAHMGALLQGRRTVGVLANGIDIRYPRRNADIYQAIIGTPGCGLVSEYPPGIIADRWTFVRRNRIISGLSHGVVVVKAGDKSGALITAGYAVEQNREVFACPGGSFNPDYAGCHRLIRNGAHLVSDTRDILAELGPVAGDLRTAPAASCACALSADHAAAKADETTGRCDDTASLSDVERVVVGLVTSGSWEIDTLIRSSGFATDRVTEALIMLEMAGYIARDGTRIRLLQK